MELSAYYTLAPATSRTKAPYLAIIRGWGRLTKDNPIVVCVTAVNEPTMGSFRFPAEATAVVLQSPSKPSSDYAVGKTIRITNFDGIVRVSIKGLPSVPSNGSAKAAIRELETMSTGS